MPSYAVVSELKRIWREKHVVLQRLGFALPVYNDTATTGKLGSFTAAWDDQSRKWIVEGPVPVRIAQEMYKDPTGRSLLWPDGETKPQFGSEHVDPPYLSQRKTVGDPGGPRRPIWSHYRISSDEGLKYFIGIIMQYHLHEKPIKVLVVTMMGASSGVGYFPIPELELNESAGLRLQELISSSSSILATPQFCVIQTTQSELELLQAGKLRVDWAHPDEDYGFPVVKSSQ